MMAGNPRKFSEKIAIQQRKLNEEQNAFDSIIAEISSIRRPAPPTQMHPNQWPGPAYVGMGGVQNGKPLTIHTRERSPGAMIHGHHFHPYRAVSPHSVSPRAISPCHQMGHEIPQQPPPQQYGNAHMYLVPPQDTNWRRTNSDPGIHASVTHPTMPGVPHQQSSHSPSPNNISPSAVSTGEIHHGAVPNSLCYLDPKANMGAGYLRPRSCENVPQLPNIHIQPSDPVAGTQIPISNNTGSLPDLPSSLLPPPQQVETQKLDDVIGSQPPPSYSQSASYVNSNQQPHHPMPAPISNALQQRHSIQLPVQYTQGGPKYAYGSGSHRLSYGPESPRSTSASPNDCAGSGQQTESSASSPQAVQSHSPDSPYCSLQAQMQNINILDLQNQPVTFASQQQQQNYYTAGNGSGTYNAYNSTGLVSSSSSQPYPNMTTAQMPMHQSEQMYEYQPMLHHQHQRYHPNLHPSSPQHPSHIPNIILTGTDGSVQNGSESRLVNGDGLYMDPTVELLSSDLRMSLDPVDLECLHGLANEQHLHIDAASEDQLRRDRV